MNVPNTVQDLDARRGWARIRAAVSCVVGVGVFALSAAALAMIVLAAMARGWSWFTHDSILDAPVWSWAPGGAGVLAILALVVAFVSAFAHFWTGATRQVLAEVRATPLDETRHVQVRNVVEALSIGIGRPVPHLAVIDDDTPNALSLRSSRTRVLCVTTGLAELPRDEIEAVCAHELGHLWARDAHFVTSGMVALARARRFGNLVLGSGVALAILVGAILYYGDTLLWGTGAIAIMLLVVGSTSGSILRRLELSVRRSADEIADVLAIRLAKNPESLGSACVRLAADADRVRHVGWRSELMWFEAVEDISEHLASQDRTTELTLAASRTRVELLARAERAYAQARVALPDVVRDALATETRRT